MLRHAIAKMCRKHFHQLGSFWLRYKRSRTAVAGLIITLLFVGMGILAPIIAPYDPKKLGENAFEPPILTWNLREHILGTDDLGRDVFSSILFGIRVSLLIGILAVALSLIIGIPLGAVSGYYGGRIDDLLMRVTELFLVIPKFFLAILCVVLFGSTLQNLIFVIGILSWPTTAKLVRAQFLAVKEQEFVEAARAMGASDRTIVLSEILPNVISSVIVNASVSTASVIITEAGLSFLGLGDPRVASLGSQISSASRFLARAWWLSFFPGLALFAIILAFNLVGEGLNETLNPRFLEKTEG